MSVHTGKELASRLVRGRDKVRRRAKEYSDDQNFRVDKAVMGELKEEEKSPVLVKPLKKMKSGKSAG